MCIVGKSKLMKLIENYKCIYPFDHNLLDGDGYILTVREETTLMKILRSIKRSYQRWNKFSQRNILTRRAMPYALAARKILASASSTILIKGISMGWLQLHQ